jgi:hypothetical protein
VDSRTNTKEHKKRKEHRSDIQDQNNEYAARRATQLSKGSILCMAAHLDRRCSCTFVSRMLLGNLTWWRHHHMIGHCVLNCRSHCKQLLPIEVVKGYHTLRALVVIRMSMRRNGCRRHRRSWAGTIWWRWVCPWRRLHVGAWC